MANYTRLGGEDASFGKMMQKFGVVTVMNAKVYEALEFKKDSGTPLTIEEINTGLAAKEVICTLDTLKIANVSVEGPTKTVTGGQYSNPLIKFGKTARLEMQDALGNAYAIDALCGGIVEQNRTTGSEGNVDTIVGLHVGSDFNGPKTIVGDSFFLDTKGNQVPVKIIFYQFLPDSIFNLTQDAEGDATVFDMNGDLLMTDVTLPGALKGDAEGDSVVQGLFYSILPVEAK